MASFAVCGSEFFFYIWSIVCIFNLSAAINVNITLLHFNMKTVEREFKSSHQKEKKFVFI